MIPVLGWLALGATAGEEALPSAARLCADAASGTEIEVCLRLAAQQPDQVERVADALRVHVDRATTTDRELLGALLLLLTDSGAVTGALALGELDDPRALRVLEHVATHSEPATARAAVIAMGAFPEALPPLARWLDDPHRPLGVRLEAARSLGRLELSDAADELIDLTRRPGIPPPLRRAVIGTLKEHYPGRARETQRHVSSDGTTWLSLGGAWGLGLALGATDHFVNGLEVLNLEQNHDITRTLLKELKEADHVGKLRC